MPTPRMVLLMKNIDLWKPSKFVPTSKGWIPSPDRKEVGIGSRFVAAVQITNYISCIRTYASGKLLDLGCGKVPYYGIYRELVSENICVDWNDNQHLESALDLNKELPFPDERFDTILCTDVLEHIINPSGLFAEMTRILQPGGNIILCVPFFYGLHEEPHDYYRYTEHCLRNFGDVNGLEILFLESYGGAPEIILDIFAKMLSSHLFLSALHLCLSLKFVRSRMGISISKWTKKRFPLGYCFVARKKA